MAEAMLALANSPALRARLGAAARRRIEADFDWDRKVETMFGIYERASRA
jgi:glycosyltransferase involved in cell wall biosynthesis